MIQLTEVAELDASLLDELERAEVREAIEEGRRDKAAGRTYPAAEVFAEINAKYGFPRKEITVTGQIVSTNAEPEILRLAFKQAALAGAPPLQLTGEDEPLVVLRKSSYQKLLDELDYADACKGIEEGYSQVAAGQGQPLEEVFAEWDAKFKFTEEVD
jgi:protein-disulfide isomerase-like protein with CxxC motif